MIRGAIELTSSLVSFKDPRLEDLRSLIHLKEALRAPAFLDLLGDVENEEVRRVFALIASDAEEERLELADLARAWNDRETPGPSEALSYRDVVHTWRRLSVEAATRARRLAQVAPSAAARMRLEALAARDEAHAELLSALM